MYLWFSDSSQASSSSANTSIYTSGETPRAWMPECVARYGMTDVGQNNDEHSGIDIVVGHLG